MDSLRADEGHGRDSDNSIMPMRIESGPYPDLERIEHKFMNHRYQQPQNI